MFKDIGAKHPLRVNSIFKNIQHAARQSLLYRTRFGQFFGALLWLSLRRDYKLKSGTRYSIRLPKLKGPVLFRAGTSDLQVFQQVICSGETDFNLGFEPRFIVDAGANIGLTSITLASKYPNCKIFALEVEETNYQMLCENVSCYPNIRPIKKALWGTDGYVKISDTTAEFWAFQVVETEQDDPDAIDAVSLATLLLDSGEKEISLLKVDIEGGEVDVFRSPLTDWIDNTKVMAVELHDRFRPGCSAALEDLLRGRQYYEYQQGEYRVVTFQASH